MQEACYCGRVDEIENREPVRGADGKDALLCPECGSVDYLDWLPDHSRRLVLQEAQQRWFIRHQQPGHGQRYLRSA